ncbi:MAG: c-type cytochrome [Polyangiaceae bacterium]|nr:c-type cytochrome [Polyangiaceae bacterium]
MSPILRASVLLATLVGVAACDEPQGALPSRPHEAGTRAAGTPADKAAPTAAAAPTIDRAALGAYKPLPAVYESPTNALTDDKIALGRMLYFDTRLSKNQDLSCNSCHGLDSFGVDGARFSKGHKGQLGGRNSPSVYNAAGHVAQFWDGRAPDVEEQAKGPVTNPVEMAMPDAASVERVLRSIPGYVELFKKVWPGDAEPVTFQHMAEAIGAFERKLTTPSRWDKYLAGDDQALTPDELRGLAKFSEVGCTACHGGAGLGGHMFQKVGAAKPYPNDKDLGRYDVTKADADRLVFRVASLRNVDKTAPYFHDGAVADLPAAVKLMADIQLGRTLSDGDAQAIVAFLGALTGEVPRDYVKKPELPPSGKDTPAPDPG